MQIPKLPAPLNVSRLIGTLSTHQYINRLKWALVVITPVTYFLAVRNTAQQHPAQPTTSTFEETEKVVNLFNEQTSVLAPYWTDEEKRKNLSTAQRTEIDFIKSLRWSVAENGEIKVDKTSSFYRV